MRQAEQAKIEAKFNQLYIWEYNSELGCSEKEFESSMLAVLKI